MNWRDYIIDGRLILPEGYNIDKLFCDEGVNVIPYHIWKALDRDKKINSILEDL